MSNVHPANKTRKVNVKLLLSRGVKRINNKTLLMYALETDHYDIVAAILSKLSEDLGLINARDDDGFHAVHYILHESKYGGFRYDDTQRSLVYEQIRVIKLLISAGADIYAIANGNPDTMLVNMAAYRSCYQILEELLPYYVTIDKSRVLFLAASAVDPEKFLRPRGRNPRRFLKEDFDLDRTLSTQCILRDLVNRRAFGLRVPEEEKSLMDQLVATDSGIREFVRNCETEFIEGTLKKRVIAYGGGSITYHQLATRCFDGRMLKGVLEDKNLVEGFEKFYSVKLTNCFRYDIVNFFVMVKIRIDSTRKRRELMGRLRAVKGLRKWIPLPYEVVLEIVEWMDNYELEKFVGIF